MNNKIRKAGLFFSIIALVLSGFTLIINWQSFLFANRPYIKITPIKLNDSGKYYSFDKNEQNDYTLNFKFRIENLGKVPANQIQVKGIIYAFIKYIPGEKIKDKAMQQYFNELENAEYIQFQDMLPDEIKDPELQKLMNQMKNKDIRIKKIPRSWKRLSLFPGESFEYVQSNKIEGKDAKWFIENFNKMKSFRLEVDVFYWGILQKIGRSYHSHAIFTIEKNELFPYESISR